MNIKKKLASYMDYILKTFPAGCASYNWLNTYDGILTKKRLPEDYEINYIIEDCLSEFSADLELCGCGCPSYTFEVLRRILNIKSKDYDYDTTKKKYNELCNSDMDNQNYYGLIQFVWYVLDRKEYLEHGSGISSTWLTEKGKIYLDLLNMEHDISVKNN